MASIRGEVIYTCSLKDESAFPWREDEGQREGILSRVGAIDTPTKHCVMWARSFQRFLFLKGCQLSLSYLFISTCSCF